MEKESWPPDTDKKAKAGVGSIVGFLFRGSFVMDMVSHLNKTGGDCFVLNKLVI